MTAFLLDSSNHSIFRFVCPFKIPKISFLFQYSLISTKPPWTKAWCYANVQPYTHSRSPLCWLQMFSSASITISWVSKSSSQPPSLSSVPHHRPHCQHRCKIHEQLTWNYLKSVSCYHVCIFQWIDIHSNNIQHNDRVATQIFEILIIT